MLVAVMAAVLTAPCRTSVIQRIVGKPKLAGSILGILLLALPFKEPPTLITLSLLF